jgi:hypothetical protein
MNPNVNTHFWKERWSNEISHKFKSTLKGVFLGRVNNIPVTDEFAIHVPRQQAEDPITMAHAINSQEKDLKNRFPMKRLFGTNRANKRLLLPIENKECHNISPRDMHGGKTMNRYKASIKTYDSDNKMHYMGSSINLSQPDIKR